MNQKGQAYIEFLIGFPATVAVSGLVLFYSLMPLARQYITTQTYEYSLCLKTINSSSCRKELDTQLKAMLLNPYTLKENTRNIIIEVPKWRLLVKIKKEAF